MSDFTKCEWIADVRGGCCAVYEKSREDDTPGMHFDDDRNIYYSNQGAKYNGHHWEMSPEAIANAHLIAAAPEMYEMLKALRDECEMFYSEFGEPSNREYIAVFCDVDNLLAKARGEHV